MAIVMSVNAGSSSFKFQVFEMPEEKVLAQGNVERIGLENSIFGMKFDGNKIEEVCDIPDHAVAVQKIMDALVDNHIVNQLEDIQDISVSRSKNNVKWGIDVLDDAEQSIYVWIDALSNYITAIGYDPENPSEQFKKLWPVDVHVIGKDILKFHSIYWIAILMAQRCQNLSETLFLRLRFWRTSSLNVLMRSGTIWHRPPLAEKTVTIPTKILKKKLMRTSQTLWEICLTERFQCW